MPVAAEVQGQAVAGIVLCGGASRRMGRSKAALPFGPESLVERAVRQLAGVFDPIVVAAAPSQILPDFDPRHVWIVRDPSPHQGPMHGLAAALAALTNAAEFAYLAAVDTPRFSSAWARLLTDRIGGSDAAAAIVDGRLQPFGSLYRVAAARKALDRLMFEGIGRLTTLLERLDTTRIGGAELAGVDPDGVLFRDLDRPEEYRRALAEMADDPVPPGHPRGHFDPSDDCPFRP